MHSWTGKEGSRQGRPRTFGGSAAVVGSNVGVRVRDAGGQPRRGTRGLSRRLIALGRRFRLGGELGGDPAGGVIRRLRRGGWRGRVLCPGLGRRVGVRRWLGRLQGLGNPATVANQRVRRRIRRPRCAGRRTERGPECSSGEPEPSRQTGARAAVGHMRNKLRAIGQVKCIWPSGSQLSTGLLAGSRIAAGGPPAWRRVLGRRRRDKEGPRVDGQRQQRLGSRSTGVPLLEMVLESQLDTPQKLGRRDLELRRVRPDRLFCGCRERPTGRAIDHDGRARSALCTRRHFATRSLTAR